MLLYTKETLNRVKIELTEWEKIFENYAMDKGPISSIYKNVNKYTREKQPH